MVGRNLLPGAPGSAALLICGIGAVVLLGGVLGFLSSTDALRTQNARQQALAYLFHAPAELTSLQSVLLTASGDANRNGAREAQQHFQKTLDGFQAVAAQAPPLPMAPHGDLRDLLSGIADDLKKVREDVAVLEHSGPKADVVGLAGRIGDAGEKFDAVDWDRIESLAAQNQEAFDNRADRQLLLLIAILLVIPVLLLVSLFQGWSIRQQRRALERSDIRFRQMCNTDTLTGLENREAFLERVNEAFTDRPEAQGYGVVVLKISGLNNLNVQFGYSFGDQVIGMLGQDLSDYAGLLHHRNMIARTGGAEFSLLVRGVETVTELRILALMLLAIVSAAKQCGDMCISLQGHAGVALGGPAVGCARDLLLRADLAMQEAATESADGVAVYSQPLRAAQLRKKKIEDELQSAIEFNHIYPVYQPQFDLRTGKMVGMEALARWNHPELGMIPPPEFIAASERVGGIVQIGRHILKTACEDAVTMRGNPCVSVNLSVLQIVQDDVPEFARSVLLETGLDPGRLKLEVTESVIIGDSRTVYETLTRLKRLGIAISLDDFGTGYSALSYLTDFDWNELKIDRSFVAKALQSNRARDVARTVGALAKQMDARLTVEGIETSGQRDLFASIGYQVAQGYFYSKPLSFGKMNNSPYVLTTRDRLN
ncbi:bifunctional diguanylate cyclase/phosphodiesterase [Roseibium sp.]|uniref:putative bifunctional diguanylate cyclase/phosphodiesterase n=3 Tax=Roseibium sp. TaxID=1936156 RepID=UPI00326641BE